MDLRSWFQPRSQEEVVEKLFSTSRPPSNASGEHSGGRCRCGRGWLFGEEEVCFKCKKERTLPTVIFECKVCPETVPKEQLWAGRGATFAPPHTSIYSVCRCADCGYPAVLPKGEVEKLQAEKTQEEELQAALRQPVFSTPPPPRSRDKPMPQEDAGTRGRTDPRSYSLSPGSWNPYGEWCVQGSR